MVGVYTCIWVHCYSNKLGPKGGEGGGWLVFHNYFIMGPLSWWYAWYRYMYADVARLLCVKVGLTIDYIIMQLLSWPWKGMHNHEFSFSCVSFTHYIKVNYRACLCGVRLCMCWMLLLRLQEAPPPCLYSNNYCSSSRHNRYQYW